MSHASDRDRSDQGNSNGTWIGRSVPRVEDDRLLRGNGRYVDDIALPGAVEAAFLRSPHAHARIESVDVTAALTAPGVVAVWTGDDVADLPAMLNKEELRTPPGLAALLDPLVRMTPMPLLARDKVLYVGQPVAVVLAENRYLAEDALELVEVRYAPLRVLVDPEHALGEDAVRLHEDLPDNTAVAVATRVGDPEAAFAGAHAVVSERFEAHRYVASPIETRAVSAQVDPYSGRLTVWSGTQTPHRLRDAIAHTLGLESATVHVIAADVGGGFGQKGILYVEELLVPHAARRLGRPVLWREDRNENLTASSHAREQIHRIELAADAEGRIVAVRDRITVNFGAYNMTGLVVPYNSLCHLLGPYRVPNVHIDVTGVLTNTTFATPYRGAGRPETVFAMERAMDRLAAELGIEPAQLRARNLVRPDEMPYATGLVDRSGSPQSYDSGDFPELLRRAVAKADVEGVRARQREGARDGKYVGIGFAMYIEATGLGPFETARIDVAPSGRVRLAIGAPSQGQGHRTSMAQIAADAIGVPFDVIDVVGGDTEATPFGVGTIASRALVNAGNATHRAGRLVREKIVEAAARRLGVDAGGLDLSDGIVRAGEPGGPSISLAELAGKAPLPGIPEPTDGRHGTEISETVHFRPPGFAVASGAHAAVVEVDEHTGEVEILHYVVVHDAGNIVNPMIAEGQVTGGIAQGIGGALYEEMVYGPDGQPRTGTYMDYLVPTSSEIPDLDMDEIFTPSPMNDLGVKGLGEGGAIAPQAVLAGAVEDALRPFDVVVRRGPLSPSRVRALIRAAADA
ncbi:xanthine dehydrogenase family protein molybdopterin-binding subunit [Streptomyces sp. P01-B04]|uniref:xanthine dehydrogenase family protein molybdopterin-binding subunit n=1 Tax=Streptomyces poriferorum TaxID=2798799 RepID=UPI001C605989|nr:xanthine dehydrogenase family protein molybdopterin-binding subunit [Streptomyces poriferorum]MBW5249221.1 xanthine dehydrogenase family protein molybdopterin-binding subunit [Streptomyces poriferorum]MBW5256728.1 xanthine dehydrogenase family protein molybdopterin-binding subunit [Streptomyces poriferorum]